MRGHVEEEERTTFVKKKVTKGRTRWRRCAPQLSLRVEFIAMQTRKLVTGLRLTWNGTNFDVALPPTPGGARCKVVQIMVAIRAALGAPTLGCKIEHGPDGVVHAVHTTINNAALPATNLYVFDSNAGLVLGDYIHCILTVGGGANGDSMTVDVYETRKPF